MLFFNCYQAFYAYSLTGAIASILALLALAAAQVEERF